MLHAYDKAFLHNYRPCHLDKLLCIPSHRIKIVFTEICSPVLRFSFIANGFVKNTAIVRIFCFYETFLG